MQFLIPVLTYRPFALDQRGAQRQLVRRQPHRFGGVLDGHTFHLNQNLSRTYYRTPIFRLPSSLAGDLGSYVSTAVSSRIRPLPSLLRASSAAEFRPCTPSTSPRSRHRSSALR